MYIVYNQYYRPIAAYKCKYRAMACAIRNNAHYQWWQ